MYTWIVTRTMNFEISKSAFQSFLALAILLIFVMVAATGWFSPNQQIPFEPAMVAVDTGRSGHDNSQSIEYFRTLFHAIAQVLREDLIPHNAHQKASNRDQSDKNLSDFQIGQIKKQETIENEVRLIKEEVHAMYGLILNGIILPCRNNSLNPTDTLKKGFTAPMLTSSEQLVHKLKNDKFPSRVPVNNATIATDQDDYPSLIAKVRVWDAMFHESSPKNQESQGQEPDPDASRRLDCFNISTCILIKHQPYGRSGNRIVQLGKVEAMLATCSGGAISSKEVRDDVVHFPSMQIFGKPSCLPAWKRLTDVEHILGLLQTRCQVFDFSWAGSYDGMNCSLKSPPAFYRVHLDSCFPSWLEISLEAWATPLSNDTAVLHFRGGDVFRTPPHPGYTQPVCDHYLQSFRHSGAACAVLVAEDDANPCLAAMQASLNCTHRPARCGPACAFTLLARARLIVSSFSTFIGTALNSFSGVERRVYSGYCSGCPRRRGDTTNLCTETNRSGLFPWNASLRQLELLRTRPASVVLC